MQKLKQKFTSLGLANKGSVLAFSLIIMGMMLVVALGLASVSSIERKTSSSTNKSNQSFQVADSGVEMVLNRIKNAAGLVDIANLGSGLTCDATTGNISASLSNGTVDVALLDEAGAPVSCNSSTRTLADVKKIKSVGTFAGTTRAIEAAVAASCGTRIVKNSCSTSGCTAVCDCSSGGCGSSMIIKCANGRAISGSLSKPAAEQSAAYGFMSNWSIDTSYPCLYSVFGTASNSFISGFSNTAHACMVLCAE